MATAKWIHILLGAPGRIDMSFSEIARLPSVFAQLAGGERLNESDDVSVQEALCRATGISKGRLFVDGLVQHSEPCLTRLSPHSLRQGGFAKSLHEETSIVTTAHEAWRSINSIPYYVDNCDIFVAVVPPLQPLEARI